MSTRKQIPAGRYYHDGLWGAFWYSGALPEIRPEQREAYAWRPGSHRYQPRWRSAPLWVTVLRVAERREDGHAVIWHLTRWFKLSMLGLLGLGLLMAALHYTAPTAVPQLLSWLQSYLPAEWMALMRQAVGWLSTHRLEALAILLVFLLVAPIARLREYAMVGKVDQTAVLAAEGKPTAPATTQEAA